MSDKPVPITPDKLATIAAIEALREYYHETKGRYDPLVLGRIIKKHVQTVITQVYGSVLEDIAQQVDATAPTKPSNEWGAGYVQGVKDCASSIRALKDK